MTTRPRPLDLRRAPSGTVAPLAFCLAPAAATPQPVAQPMSSEVTPEVAAALRVADARGTESFRAALRRAIAASPSDRDAILRHALAAHPERSAELLLGGLFTPTLQPPALADSQAAVTPPGHTTNRPVALPLTRTEQAAKTPEAFEETGPWDGTVVLGATVRTGNTENAGLTSELTLSYASGPWRHEARGSLDYLRNRAETSSRPSLDSTTSTPSPSPMGWPAVRTTASAASTTSSPPRPASAATWSARPAWPSRGSRRSRAAQVFGRELRLTARGVRLSCRPLLLARTCRRKA